jgi:hypothetical protein
MPCGYHLPILEQKPGALQHGAPFQQWDLPTPIRIVRGRLLKQDKGDRAFVELLLIPKGHKWPEALAKTDLKRLKSLVT